MQSDPPNPAHRAPGLTAVPLFHAAWLFAAGIVVARWLWLRPALLLVAVGLVAALCVVAVRGGRAQRIVWVPLAALWLLLGAWSGEMEPHPTPEPALAALSDGLARTVEGTVVDAAAVRSDLEQNVDEPATTQPTQRVDVRVATMEVVDDQNDAQAPVTGKVRLTVRWPVDAAVSSGAQGLQCGERIRAAVRLLPPLTYHDPGFGAARIICRTRESLRLPRWMWIA